jgi:hypothetical protein
MSTAERNRSAARIDRLVALPIAAGVALWWKAVAAATAGLIGVGVAVVTLAPPAPSPAPATVVPSMSAKPSIPASAAPRPVSSAVIEPEVAASEAPPVPSAPVARVMPSSPRVVVSEAPVVASAAPSASAPVVDTSDSLAREAQLLEQARGLLGSNPSGALAKLDEHAATFPRGKLGLEREFLAVDALRRAGRTGEARTRGEALLARSRGSLYEERVQKMLDRLP